MYSLFVKHLNQFVFSRPSSGIGGGVGIGGAAGTSARKLVIKPFKVQPKIPDNFEIETWEKLKNAIQSVYSKNASLLSKEELYRVSIYAPVRHYVSCGSTSFNLLN